MGEWALELTYWESEDWVPETFLQGDRWQRIGVWRPGVASGYGRQRPQKGLYNCVLAMGYDCRQRRRWWCFQDVYGSYVYSRNLSIGLSAS